MPLQKDTQTVINGFHFGSGCPFTQNQASEFLAFLAEPGEPPEDAPPLSGRRGVRHALIHGLGRVVVKHYTRGGILGLFVRGTYLKTGKIRSRIEYDWLSRVRKLGVCAPEPVAYVWRGSIFYQCWLVSREIEDHQTLAAISLLNEDRAKRLLPVLRNQVSLLVKNNILHVDFHPGNVLVNERDEIFLIDFDKARCGPGNPSKLKTRYALRWQRAVAKHRLPDLLNSVFD
jgi:3-deoxy-D-manno-octulosonic acid kinase